MIFRTPMPFKQALDSHDARAILPSEFRHSAMQQLAPQVKARAFWSAGVTSAEFLERAHDAIGDMLSGNVDRATKRTELKKLLDSMGYHSPEGEEGTLTDLRSDSRLNLILDTNTQLAEGFGHKAEGNDSTILDAWPAQELFRAVATGKQRNWPDRWAEVGGQFFDGRMIALKNDPIWSELGSSENFEDALDVDYPPFAFNSGMRVRDIARAEAMDLGLIDRDTELFPQALNFNEGVEASLGIVDHQLRQSIVGQMLDLGIRALFDKEGVLRFAGMVGGGS